ncbi:hypothetical protein HanHA300_Chr16g0614521 [Helianthus annuus]|nr:hypothetical protein HanHA300_Chr16g0614521 [Helianthus annuus]
MPAITSCTVTIPVNSINFMGSGFGSGGFGIGDMISTLRPVSSS